MQLFRSQVGSGSREQVLGVAERMIFFNSLPLIGLKPVKELRHGSAVGSTLSLETSCTERSRLKLIILDSKNSAKLSARVSRESYFGKVGAHLMLNNLSTNLKSCF